MNKKLTKHITQKKNPKNSNQKDKSASLSPEFFNLNRLQKNSNDEKSKEISNFSKIANDEKMNKSKSEFIMQKQVPLPSVPLNDETKNVNRYCFDSETKNFEKNIDKFKMENEEDFKHSDKDVIKYNSTKRSTSANNSPYKEKKRKFFFDKTENNHEFLETGTTHLETNVLHRPVVKTVYYSYFEHGCDDRDEIREIK